jgi:hypothetical protein
VKEAHALAAEIGGYIYGEKENGGTNTIYVSPVPFDSLDKGIQNGAGKPHLGAVGDSMGHAENMGKAMLIAPLAGIAAAGGKFYGFTKKLHQSQEGKG